MGDKANKIAFDTNIIIYSLDAGSPHNKSVKTFAKECTERNIELCAASQAIPEAVNTLVLDCGQKATTATAIVENFLDTLAIEILYPRAGSISLFYEYSTHLKLHRRTFDLFMSAVLVDRGINTLCTYNTKDFQDIPYITAARPEDLLKQRDI